MNEHTDKETRAEPTARGSRRHTVAVYQSLVDAAPLLGMTVQALRARCRRHAVREGREVRAHLGDGVVATKFGRTWRVRFPPM
jgi:hypothetical protein